MNRNEYNSLINNDHIEVIKANNLSNKEDRTLLYGYTFERNTHHTYIKNGKIYSVVYDHNDTIMSEFDEDYVNGNSEWIPCKRIYPEASDYEFCNLLEKCGEYLSFTVFNEAREAKQFYGNTIEELR